MDENGLEFLFEPYSTAEFLSGVYGKTFAHIPALRERFADLLPWNALNTILSRHRLDYPRIRLSKDGQNVPSETFIRQLPARRGGTIPRIIVSSLFKQLRGGATLIVDAVDEAYAPISAVAEYLERLLREYVQVNAYVGWGETKGFDLHWDDHDVIILQVAGRKSWQVYNPTRLYPMYRDIEPNLDPPTGKPLWEGMLSAGDLLYVPRGWWHVATPLNDATVHLTFGIVKRTGVDLISWLGDQLRSRPACRMDLPRFAEPAEQLKHLEAIKTEFLSMWEGDFLQRYFCELDEAAQPRTYVSFPFAAQREFKPDSDDLKIRLTAGRPIFLGEDGADNMVKLSANGKALTFKRPAAIILTYLINHQVCVLRDVYNVAEGVLSREVVRAFVGELLAEGLIAILPDA